MALTVRICEELKAGGNATASEIAIYLDANPKDCAGALSNLKKSGHVKVAATKPVGVKNVPANVYELVRMPPKKGPKTNRTFSQPEVSLPS